MALRQVAGLWTDEAALAHSSDFSLPCTRRTGTGRPRPASAVRKIVAAHTLASLDDAASRDALRRQMSGGIIAGGDLGSTGSQRPNSPRGIAAPIFLLRGAWPAPDGRGRPAPARRGRAALSCDYHCDRGRHTRAPQVTTAALIVMLELSARRIEGGITHPLPIELHPIIAHAREGDDGL